MRWKTILTCDIMIILKMLYFQEISVLCLPKMFLGYSVFVVDLFYYNRIVSSDTCTLKSHLNAGHRRGTAGVLSRTHSECYVERVL